jgi:predicted DsbA family dithiol-disulfide isomerase
MHSRLVHATRVLAGSASKPQIKIDVWSDIACPWCYIGKKRLDAAMAALGDQADFRPEWHAYLLEPDFQPSEGEPLLN